MKFKLLFDWRQSMNGIKLGTLVIEGNELKLNVEKGVEIEKKSDKLITIKIKKESAYDLYIAAENKLLWKISTENV